MNLVVENRNFFVISKYEMEYRTNDLHLCIPIKTKNIINYDYFVFSCMHYDCLYKLGLKLHKNLDFSRIKSLHE